MVRESKRRSEGEDEPEGSVASKRSKLESSDGTLTQRTKRMQRQASALPETYSEDEDESDDDDFDEEQEGRINVGNQFDDADIDDAYLQRKWDVESERRQKDGKSFNNKYAENAGWIKQIHLVDFMCHRNLSVDLGKNLNFLVGHNGSGKSAILTALAIGLGGKAAATKRANGAKDLIRGSEERAVITLILHNRGYSAFRPDVYKENIIIERTIHRKNGGSWKFRATRNGDIFSNKKAELDSIRTFFRIDCDQPLTVLTQDAARNFLQQSDPRSLYDFFLTGTGLKAIWETYKRAASNLEVAQANAATQIASIEALKEQANSLEEDVQRHEKLEDQRRQLGELQSRRLWAEVRDKEVKFNEASAVIRAIAGVKAKEDKKIQEFQEKLDAIAADVVSVEEELKANGGGRSEMLRKRDETKKRHQDARDQLGEHEDQMAQNHEAVEDCEAAMEKARQEMEEKERAQGQDVDPAITALRTRIDQHLDLASKIRVSRTTKDAAVIEAEKARDEAHHKRQEAENAKLEANRDVIRAEENEQRAQRISRDRLATFGNRVDIVLAEIDRERWSGIKPIGPIGRHIQLKSDDRNTGRLFTALLGGLLPAFIVTTPDDRGKLQQLLQACTRKGYSAPTAARRDGRPPQPVVPQIITNSGDIFDYSAGDRERYGTNVLHTLMSALNFDNELVRRVLINTNSIERQFYTQDREHANKEIANRLVPHFGQATVHCTDGSTLVGDRSSTSFSPWKCNVSMFVADTAAQIRDAQIVLDNARSEHSAKSTAFTEAVGRLQDAEKALADAKRAAATDAAKLKTVEAKIETMRQDLPTEESIDVEALRETIDLKRVELERLKASLLSGEALKTQLEAEVETARKARVEAQAVFDEAEPSRIKSQEALQRLSLDHTEQKRHLALCQTSVDKLAQDQNAAVAQKDALAAELEATTKLAADAGARVAERRTVRELDKLVGRIEETLRKHSSLSANALKLVREKRDRVVAKIDLIEKQMADFNRTIKVLDAALTNRDHSWIKMRAEASMRARVIFMNSMSKRDFEARITLKHGSQELIMGVVASKKSQTSDRTQSGTTQYKSALVLSGGERSFSTVSLLLALWESAGGPLRCMDEWDVFLDGVNRDLAAGMLIEGAKQTTGKQYILITPQNMGRVPIEGGDNKIIRMADPDRNQGTLGFGST